MIVSDFLRNTAGQYPDKIAVIHLKESFTYSELDRLSDIFAVNLIKKGIRKGDRIALVMDNCCEYLIYYFGILKSGAAVVALNSQLLSGELIHPLNDCSAKIAVTDKKYSQTVKDAIKDCEYSIELLIAGRSFIQENKDSDTINFLNSINNMDDDLAAIIYTSGTTGKPKGVMLSHGNLSANADSIVEYLNLTSKDKIMVVLPFYYSYGMSLLTTHVKAGGTLVINNRFVYPNVILDTMVKEEVTGFAGVPSHFIILIKKSAIRKYSFPKLRYVTQAGGAMPPAMIKEFRVILPDVEFIVMYGQTEATARLSYLAPKFLNEKTGSVGKAIPGVELDILDDNGNKVAPGRTGEIVARGTNITKGYWNDPDETANVLRDGWLYTGDLARIDKDGFIYIVSRKKDMIKSGANRISPYEIEDVVCRMSGIEECAVVGVPDEILGEVIKLFIIVSDPGTTDKEVMIFCKDNLAFYKVPKYVEIISELPRTSTGKIKRMELAKT